MLEEGERDGQDLKYIAKNHKYSEYEEIYENGFIAWVDYLQDSLYLQKSGYPLDRDEFSYLEWIAMGIISDYQRSRSWQSMQEQP